MCADKFQGKDVMREVDRWCWCFRCGSRIEEPSFAETRGARHWAGGLQRRARSRRHFHWDQSEWLTLTRARVSLCKRRKPHSIRTPSIGDHLNTTRLYKRPAVMDSRSRLTVSTTSTRGLTGTRLSTAWVPSDCAVIPMEVLTRLCTRVCDSDLIFWSERLFGLWKRSHFAP